MIEQQARGKAFAMNLTRSVLLGIILIVSASSTLAQLVNGRLTTSFYTLQRFDTVGSSKTYLRAYQTVQLSAAQGDFSLHTMLQGAMNGTNDFGDVGRIRFYNLYLTWANIGRALDLNFGRQALYAGVANGTIDGLLARARLWKNQITVTGFGGATVNSDFTGIRKNIHDNYSIGGQVVTTALEGARVGISYMNRHEERDPYWALRNVDTTFAPRLVYISTDSPAEEYGSADVYYTYGSLFSVYGRYDYDFNLTRTSRGQGGARVNVTDALSLTADYVYRAPHIAYNSIFSVFTSNSTNEFEGGIDYSFNPMLHAFARLGRVTYTSTLEDKSTRWTLGLNTGYGSFSYSGGNGYAGELQSVSLQGSYPCFGRMLIPTLGLTYASYRLDPELSTDRDNALSVLLGAIVRPSSSFSFDVQGQWLTNKILNHDMRLQVRLMYWFAQRLSIFKQEVNQ